MGIYFSWGNGTWLSDDARGARKPYVPDSSEEALTVAIFAGWGLLLMVLATMAQLVILAGWGAA